jgi:dienelactone hydrolase
VSRPLVLENDEGLAVRCDVRTPPGPGPFPVVVVLHGFKGFKDWGMFPPTCERLAAAGLASVAMNASRNGIGAGDPCDLTELDSFARDTPRRQVADVRLVVDAIASGAAGPGLDPARIGLLGHSRGGAVVVLAAAADPRVRALVTWAGVASLDRWTERAKEGWRRTGRLDVPNARTGQVLWLERSVLEDVEASAREYDVLAAASRLRVPYLVIHGQLDEAVAATEARRLFQATGSAERRVTIVPRTGHTFGSVHPWAGPNPAWDAVVGETAGWFVGHLGAQLRDQAGNASM